MKNKKSTKSSQKDFRFLLTTIRISQAVHDLKIQKLLQIDYIFVLTPLYDITCTLFRLSNAVSVNNAVSPSSMLVMLLL